MRYLRPAGLILILLLAIQPASAATVFVDFTSDTHDGAGTASPNATADWIDELDELTGSLAVTDFTPAERATIEANIVAQLASIYAGYTVSFTTTAPGAGTFSTINMGFDDDPSFGSLGVAPVDIANLSEQTSNVAPANFGFSLDEYSGVGSRATQITDISTALAGTAAHELGHSLGLLHHHSYSDPLVEPGTYAATGGVQNGYILATGPTGLDEAGRETLRTLSPWSRALLDITGGAALAPGLGSFDHESYVTTPVMLDTSEEDSFDAGGTIGTAASMPAFTMGETSGLALSFLSGNLDAAGGGAADLDFYSFTSPGPGRFLAEIFSSNRFGAGFDFDAELTLFNSAGVPLFANDDVFFDGNTYDSGTKREDDPFLLNVPIPGAGTYYLRVANSPSPDLTASTGDVYWLLAGLDAEADEISNPGIPEPSTGLLIFGLLGGCLLRRRK